MRRCRDAGVDVLQGAFIDEIELGADGHVVTIVRGGPGGDRSSVEARWLVDATGRGSLLKRKLGLERSNAHHINSAWFRLDGGLDLEQWSDNEEWLGRMPERGVRKHSTNHLAGEGYWIWMIQLATGPISIGVSADPRFHPFEQINDLDRLLEWFARHEPQLAASVAERRDRILDFLVIQDFSYGCERVFSPDRWCLTGEAGVFLDPLYSPGSDFIAISNTFITELIERDLSGERISPSASWRRLRTRLFFSVAGKSAARAGKNQTARPAPFDIAKATRKVAADSPLEFLDFFYLQLYTGALRLYQDEYELMGNPQVLLAKSMFDTIAYWSNLALLFFHGKFADVDFLASLIGEQDRFNRVVSRMQRFFREWHELDQREWTGVSILATSDPPFRPRQDDLIQPFDDEALRARFVENVDRLYAMAVILFHKAAEALPEKPDEDTPINPLAISLQPDRWRKDGLFSGRGITLRQASEMAPRVEDYFLDRRGATVLR